MEIVEASDPTAIHEGSKMNGETVLEGRSFLCFYSRADPEMTKMDCLSSLLRKIPNRLLFVSFSVRISSHKSGMGCRSQEEKSFADAYHRVFSADLTCDMNESVCSSHN